MRLTQLLHKEMARREGMAGMEMAICFTLLLALMLPMIDVAQIVIASMQLNSAVRTGSQYAMSYPGDTAGIQSAVTQATSLPAASVSAGASSACECNGAAAACGSNCAGTLATYTTITASYNVPLIMGSGYPGLANPYPLSKQVIVRTN